MNIEWKFNGITIEVKCPKCGRWGKLVSKGKRKLKAEPKFMVRHEKGTCSIGKCSDCYDELAGIYKYCRKAREGRKRDILIKLAKP